MATAGMRPIAELNALTPTGHAKVAQGQPWQMKPGEQTFLNVMPNIPRFRRNVETRAV